MIQINNGFAEYYYLTEAGIVFNKKTNKYIYPDIKHSFKLKTIDNRYKSIRQKTLYKKIYNKTFSIDKIKDLDGEQWKEIDNTDGNYFVSNKGRIKSLAGYEAILLKPWINKSGYYRLDISIEGQKQTKLIHRIVAAAFLLPPEHIDYQLHHKDFNKLNNAADNLEWLSRQQHILKHTKKEQKKNE